MYGRPHFIMIIALVASLLGTVASAQEKKPIAAKPGSDLESTYAYVSYGPHTRNVMDVWLSKSTKSQPVLVSIHGGGFEKGEKTIDRDLLKRCLDAKIAVIAINYRLSQDAIAPAAFLDSARAIQFIRHHAKEWNLDPRRVAATGASAGAGIALWLGFHDDLADQKNADPIQRESTRLTCMAVLDGQCSYDPRFIKQLIPENDTYKSRFLAAFFGVKLDTLDNLPPEKYRLFEEVSAINFLTKDDPPVLQLYGYPLDTPVTDQNIGIHHPRFGKILKEKMDALGIPCELTTKQGSGQTIFAFIKKHFGMD